MSYLHGHANIGYGAAHNLVMHGGNTHYHLVLNPDVELDVDALAGGTALFRRAPRRRRHRARRHQCGRRARISVQALSQRRRPRAARVGAAWLRPAVSPAPRSLRDARCDEERRGRRDRVAGAGDERLVHAAAAQGDRGDRRIRPRHFSSTSRTSTGACGSIASPRARTCPAVRVVHHGGGAAAQGLAPHRVLRAQRACAFSTRTAGAGGERDRGARSLLRTACWSPAPAASSAGRFAQGLAAAQGSARRRGARAPAPATPTAATSSRWAILPPPTGHRCCAGVDTIVHLAGRAHVRDGSDASDPTPFVVANVHVTRRLLDAALRGRRAARRAREHGQGVRRSDAAGQARFAPATPRRRRTRTRTARPAPKPCCGRPAAPARSKASCCDCR